MKTAEELTAIKEEIENLNKKLAELTEQELAQVAGGAPLDINSLLDITRLGMGNESPNSSSLKDSGPNSSSLKDSGPNKLPEPKVIV